MLGRMKRLPQPAPAKTSMEPASHAGLTGAARIVGGLILVLPWVWWPGGGVTEPYIDPKWPVALLGVACALGLGVGRRVDGQSVQRGSFLAIGFGLMMAGMLVSAVTSEAPGLGLVTTLRQGGLLGLAWLCSRFNERERAALCDCLIASCGLQAGLTLIQYGFPEAMASIVPYAGRGARAAMIGTLGNPEFAAGYCGLGCALAAGGLALGKPEAGAWLGRGWRVAAAVGCAISVMLSGGRGAALAVGAGLGIFGVVKAWRAEHGVQVSRRRGKLVLIMLICLAGVGMMITAMPRGGEQTLPGRIAQLADPHSASMRQRIGLYTITSHMIWENPLLGAGPGRFGTAFAETRARLALDPETGIGFWQWGQKTAGRHAESAHSEPLQWWAEYGLAPIAGLFLLLAVALVNGSGALRSGAGTAQAALFAGLLFFSVNMWVSYPLSMPARAVAFWIIVGLLARPPLHPDGPGQKP